ncbi:MAG: YciI family protein [Blastocatellia bacterium]|nr:YciI family protein [Blastocatellia bacterium]
MEYMILIYSDEQAWANMPQDQLKAVYGEYMSYSQELAEAGVIRGGSELAPSTSATTLSLRNGEVVTTDGPYAETKEQLGGYYLIEAENLDQALAWARKCPGVKAGHLEVRPLMKDPTA